MRLFLPAGRNDFHARVVKRAMEIRGHHVDLFATEDFFLSDTLNFELAGSGSRRTLAMDGHVVELGSYDVVWNRRPFNPPTLDHVFPADRTFVTNEIRAALWGLYHLLEDARWVNPLEAALAAENKILQLMHAPACGLQVPETLVSTDPDSIRAFVADGGTVVYKPLTGFVWEESGLRRATYTSVVKAGHFDNRMLIATTPGIYQRRVKRSHEVRVQVYGASALALGIWVEDAACTDWRLTLDRKPRCAPIEVPAAVLEACRGFMQRLGLLCGAFDFIVDGEGRWIFLEVNQGGQFLFLEEWCPELPVLEMLCHFLEDPSPEFTCDYRALRPRYEGIANELSLREPAAA